MNSEDIYRNMMGPYFYEYCKRLHALASLYSKLGKTKICFCWRAGLVLQFLFDYYIRSNGIKVDYSYSDFPYSRLIAVKLAIKEDAMWGGHVASIVFPGKNLIFLLEKLLSGVHGFEDYKSKIQSSLLIESISPHSVRKLINFDRANKLGFYDYLCSEHLNSSLYNNFSDSEILVISDSGLYGSISEVLTGIYPEKKIVSGFVYLSNYKKIKPACHFELAYGLMGCSDSYNYLEPSSAVLKNWHFIEELLEPSNVKSVKTFMTEEKKEIILNERQLLIFDFFKKPIPYEIENIFRGINKLICNPNKIQISLLYTGQRVNDISNEVNSILINKELEKVIRDKDKLRNVNIGIVNRALWKEGQIVLSYGFYGYILNSFIFILNRLRSFFQRNN